MKILPRLHGSQGLVVFIGFFFCLFAGTTAVKAQCSLTSWMRNGYCYDWGNSFSGQTVTVIKSNGKYVIAQTPIGILYGEFFNNIGDVVLNAGNQQICCYGQRSTGRRYGYCSLCE
ncbi:MAG: hypothetical protein HQ457_10810 [Betaproteobacteria bacterium]|nr:hypothetical protein [Betaproteobacteria bacterium]